MERNHLLLFVSLKAVVGEALWSDPAAGQAQDPVWEFCNAFRGAGRAGSCDRAVQIWDVALLGHEVL